jgi:hypothetical protein
MSENIEDDPLEEIEVQLEAEEPPEAPVLPPEDGVAELKEQLKAERAARADAERRANEAARREHATRLDKDDTDLQLVANAIDTLARDNDILKHGYQVAMQSQDFARAAEIQQEMSENAAKLLQLNNGYEAMKAKPKAPAPPVHADPVEAFASALSPRSADWVRAHPEFVRDPKLNRKMIAAHELAMADGHAADTDDYFAAIEETLRVRPKPAPVVDDAMDTSAKVVARRDAAPAAAPVSRGQPSRNIVRLNAAEREMAEMMNMKPEEYAKHKQALQKEGKLQ